MIPDLGEEAERERLTDDPRLVAVPRGAMALAGLMVTLLVLAWVGVYFGVFLARGGVR